MDFTLSLAHFCELHGPTSVICTQTLATDCDRCHPYSPPVTPLSSSSHDEQTESYFTKQYGRRSSLAPGHPTQAGEGARCDSCCIKSPPAQQQKKSREESVFIQKDTAIPFRTKETVHICADCVGEDEQEEIDHTARCHDHNVEYISSSSPVEPEIFVTLRNSTVRTLSGEQLPKGQRQGPLCFGDPATGYTVAYYFRLADGHARGKERYYALVALVGTETRRAFESCTLIWNLFEQIALRIVEEAEAVLQQGKPKVEVGRKGEESAYTSVSSFLTQRALDPDGVPRRGAESVRPNNISELVGNGNFFCELHMMFAKMLQELGKVFGGLKINPKPDEPETLAVETPQEPKAADTEEEGFRMSPLAQEMDAPRFTPRSVPRFEIPDYSHLTPTPSPKRQAVHG